MQNNKKLETSQFLESSFAEQGQLLVLFKGDIDPATGKNWCSDCVKAEPYIEQFAKPLAIKKGIDLWTVVVGVFLKSQMLIF